MGGPDMTKLFGATLKELQIVKFRSALDDAEDRLLAKFEMRDESTVK